MFSSYYIIEDADAQSDSDDCVIIEVDDEDDITNNLNFMNEKCKNEPSSDFNEDINDQEMEQADEDEDEDDVLVVGCDSDDDIDGILNRPEEESNIKVKVNKTAVDTPGCHEVGLPEDKIRKQVTASVECEKRNSSRTWKERLKKSKI